MIINNTASAVRVLLALSVSPGSWLPLRYLGVVRRAAVRRASSARRLLPPRFRATHAAPASVPRTLPRLVWRGSSLATVALRELWPPRGRRPAWALPRATVFVRPCAGRL